MSDIVRKAAVLLLNFQECPCIGNGSLYFQAVSYDAGITPQCFQLVLSVSADFLRIKIVKSHAKGISLIQNTFPGQARLKALQYQHFKELPVIMHRNAPLLIVITNVTLISRICPAASYLTICPLHPYTAFPKFILPQY